MIYVGTEIWKDFVIDFVHMAQWLKVFQYYQMHGVVDLLSSDARFNHQGGDVQDFSGQLESKSKNTAVTNWRIYSK